MDIYYLNFNNYYNRQLKVLSSLSDYLPYVIGTSESGRNFNPANDITVKFVTNRQRDEVGDYMLAVDDGVIVSRWFILNGDRTREGQYLLTVRRDVLADYYTQVLTAPCFIEKATLETGDPMIFNKEDMTVNQIKTSETQLKDETGCAWVVGYVPSNAFSQSQTIPAQYISSTIQVDDTYESLSEFPYYDYINNRVLWDKPYGFNIYTYVGVETRPNQSFRLAWNLMNNYTEALTLNKSWTGGYHCNGNIDPYGNIRTWLNAKIFYQAFTGSPELDQINENTRSAIYNSLLGYTLYSQNSNVDVDDFMGWNNKTIKVGSGNNIVYYKINVVRGEQPNGVATYLTSVVGTDKIVPYISLNNYVQINGSPDDQTFYIESSSYSYTIQLTQIFSTATVTIDSDRSHLEDSPYDMFCIPYSDDFVIKKSGVNFCTANKSLALSMATEIGRKSGDTNIYDIQLLPYCPCRSAIRSNGDFDIINEKYNPIKDSNDNNIGVVIWCSHSTFTFDIEHSITIFNPKVSNQCDMYRLVSPNYNGQFEFNPAMNGGVTKFNVDCAYKPYSPYIHINPDFGLLYGRDFNDARGLVCGGDFSLPQVSNAWANYQLQNKNYQEIFNRKIQNMEVGYKYQNLSQLISGSISALGTGITTGVLGGGVMGAISGITSLAGMGVDYYMNRQLQNEALDYTKDLFGYTLGNIQALPDSLTKVSPFNPNNKIFPILEYYTCTDTERQAFENKIRWNGMTVMRIGSIQEFVKQEETYIKGKIIRLLNVNEPTNVLNEIANEINKGVFIDGRNTTSS